MIAGPLARVEHADAGFGLGAGPLLELGHRVTVGAHFFMERDGRTVLQHGHLRKQKPRAFNGRRYHGGNRGNVRGVLKTPN